MVSITIYYVILYINYFKINFDSRIFEVAYNKEKLVDAVNKLYDKNKEELLKLGADSSLIEFLNKCLLEDKKIEFDTITKIDNINEKVHIGKICEGVLEKIVKSIICNKNYFFERESKDYGFCSDSRGGINFLCNEKIKKSLKLDGVIHSELGDGLLSEDKLVDEVVNIALVDRHYISVYPYEGKVYITEKEDDRYKNAFINCNLVFLKDKEEQLNNECGLISIMTSLLNKYHKINPFILYSVMDTNIVNVERTPLVELITNLNKIGIDYSILLYLQAMMLYKIFSFDYNTL